MMIRNGQNTLVVLSMVMRVTERRYCVCVSMKSNVVNIQMDPGAFLLDIW